MLVFLSTGHQAAKFGGPNVNLAFNAKQKTQLKNASLNCDTLLHSSTLPMSCDVVFPEGIFF